MSHRVGRLALTGALAAGCCCLASCQMFSWMVAAMAPPKPVPAVYEPPQDKTILVFVDDIRNPVSYEPLKAQLSRRLSDLLVEHEVARQTVAYEKLRDLALSTPDFNQWHIPTVGEKLQADLVLYVEIDRFTLREGAQGPLWQGRLETRVKIVDSRKGRIWPEDRPNGFPVKPATTEPEANFSEDYGAVLASKLANEMAERIAKLFYAHTAPRYGFPDEQE